MAAKEGQCTVAELLHIGIDQYTSGTTHQLVVL
jgi:hypothetical protein